MKHILVLGAGRSATVLIRYLLDHAVEMETDVTVGDALREVAQQKIQNHDRGKAILFDATNESTRHQIISSHDIVVSLLPPHLHLLVAKECLHLRKNLVTASYVSSEMQQLNADVKAAGLLFLCEMGLDPGIDHMSAMQLIHRIQEEGGKIISFKSGTGGLLAPESDDNPWHYKVTWNPRNVVLAGQGTAQYLEDDVKKIVPYHRLFRTIEKFKIEDLGKFESYPNRDSLQYIEKYGLAGVQTILRSTLRKGGYCDAWNALVQLGLTDDSYTLHGMASVTYAQWMQSYLPEKKKLKDKSVRERTAKFLNEKMKGDVMGKLDWLGLFSDELIPVNEATPAQILQNLIEKKWVIQLHDNDMIVMRHQIKYQQAIAAEVQDGNPESTLVSTLVVRGDDSLNTAMAKTVGLPLGIMVKLLLKQEVFLTGVHIPVMSQVYNPVLKELEEFGVKFTEMTQSS